MVFHGLSWYVMVLTKNIMSKIRLNHFRDPKEGTFSSWVSSSAILCIIRAECLPKTTKSTQRQPIFLIYVHRKLPCPTFLQNFFSHFFFHFSFNQIEIGFVFVPLKKLVRLYEQLTNHILLNIQVCSRV